MNSTKKKTKDFKFKKFNIIGGFSGMPVSTDGVLLGAWVDIDQGESILDIGTGTGLLSLMCAQRFSASNIVAVEIDSDAYLAAKLNFEQSPWLDRISIYQQDILTWQHQSTFDSIVCNPPYFNSGQHSESLQRATARHTETLNHSLLLKKCWSLLSPSGKASFVLPIVEGEAFIELATSNKWNVNRICKVKPNDKKPLNRVLIELSKQKTSSTESELVILNQGTYSKEYVSLTKEFYLKM